MAIKELRKPAKKEERPVAIDKVEEFIAQGGTLATDTNVSDVNKEQLDHRLTLRIPQWLMDKVDNKRKERVGKISRNLWILEQLQKATDE